MTIDIQKLKALAEAATQGEWGYDGSYVCTARIEAGTKYVETWSAVADCNLADNTKFIAAANPAAVLELIAENDRLQQFETAYKEFSDKTAWVVPSAETQELGMHVADILRKRCDDLTAHRQAQADEIVRLLKERDRLAADNQALMEDPGSAL